jgi:flavin reductase (DIM6/NTAB) family NADH-FMN oxidoreductase RutF
MQEELSEKMKSGMRRLVAGVSILTVSGEDGLNYAMTVSSVSSVSTCPPSLLVCINASTRISSQMVLGRYFGINILAQDHQELSTRCSSSDFKDSRFDDGTWELNKLGMPPYLTDAECVFTCAVDQKIRYGSHYIVVGLINEVRLTKDAIDPLVYMNGRYHRVAT